MRRCAVVAVPHAAPLAGRRLLAVVGPDLPPRRAGQRPGGRAARCWWTRAARWWPRAIPKHLIATIGCDDLIIVHTPDATLVCRSDSADAIKELHRQVEQRYGRESV